MVGRPRNIGQAAIVLEDPLLDRSKVAGVIQILARDMFGFSFDRGQEYEPVNRPFSPSDIPRIAEAWDGGPFYLRSRKTKVSASINGGIQPHYPSVVYLDFPPDPSWLPRVCDLMGTLGESFGGEIGFVELVGRDEAEAQLQSGASSFVRRDGSEWTLSIYPISLERSLPDLYWWMLFGPCYVEEIGRERLSTAPAFLTKAIGNWGQSVQLTADPLGAQEFHPEFLAARERVRRHLGPDLFFQQGDGSAVERRVPRNYAERRDKRRAAMAASLSGRKLVN